MFTGSFIARGGNNPAEHFVLINTHSRPPILEVVIQEPVTLLEHTSSFGCRLHYHEIRNQGTLQDVDHYTGCA